MMLVVGLHFGHDANLSIFRDGTLAYYYEKERHSRVRHALGLTGSEIQKALDRCNARIEDVDVCAITTTQRIPIYDFEGNLDFSIIGPAKVPFEKKPFSKHFFGQDHHYTGYLAWTSTPPKTTFEFSPSFPYLSNENRYVSSLADIATSAVFMDYRAFHLQEVAFSLNGKRPRKAVHLCHHLAHAQYAYSYSGFEKALVITFDGLTADDFSGGGIYFGRDGVCYPAFPHGFWGGGFYDRMSERLGLGVEGAGKLMGLAAYGLPAYYRPELAGTIAELRGRARLNMGHEVADYWLQNFVPGGGKLPDWDGWSAPPELHSDIACSAQLIFQHNVEAVVEAAAAFARRSGFSFDGICLAGGCALNCPSNSLIAAKHGRVFVPPAVNDEGLSLGSALSVATDWKRKPVSPAIAYVGGEYADRVQSYLAALPKGIAAVKTGPDTLGWLARELTAGKVAGFFHGHAEVGPRALGHRSILASPSIPGNIERVNKIKEREVWRPLAPIGTEACLRHFSHLPRDSYFMLLNARVRDRAFPAVTHVDGTARLQIATAECGPVFDLLKEMGKASGHEMLLNTSFNGRGEPIVETPDDALRAFVRMDLDYLFLEGVVLGKTRPAG